MSDGQEVDETMLKARTIYTFPPSAGGVSLARLAVRIAFFPWTK